MSPASSGALEVERYIGACLISSQSRNKGSNQSKCHNGSDSFYQNDHFVHRYVNNNNNNHLQRCRSVDGWAGGMPLISFANYQRRCQIPHDIKHQDRHNPLSRLAVHTQGAPLILTNRYNHRKNKTCNRNFIPARESATSGNKTKDVGVDTVSVNSDESSASTNSENSLPRIIKPRKRRKKDRKPPHLTRPLGTEDCFSTDSASPDIDSPSVIDNINSYLPFAFDLYHYASSNFNNNNHEEIGQQEVPKLHHSFEEVKEVPKDKNDNQLASTCQCRYCDPCGQIWDVDRNCYSPFLTTPERQFNFPDIQVEPLVRDYDTSLSSDLISTLADLSLDSVSSRRDLEVSTEIVTSHNGHRDLEIKFFSPDNGKRTRNGFEE